MPLSRAATASRVAAEVMIESSISPSLACAKISGCEWPGETHPKGKLFDLDRSESRGLRLLEHTRNTAAPLLDQIEFAKDANDEWVSNEGYAALHVLNRHARKQNPRIFDFDAVVEKGDTNGGAALGVVAMDERIDDQFT